MAYFAYTHCSDKLQWTELYKLNGTSFELKFESMLVLLSYDSEQSTATITNLLNNQEVIKSISTFLPPQKTNQVGDITVNHLS